MKEPKQLASARKQVKNQHRSAKKKVSISALAAELLNNSEFISDLARFSEQLIPERVIRKKYGFDEATWTKLGADEALVDAIELEKIRRTRSGATAREKAQNVFTKAPDILDKILTGDGVSPRHKIESARELRAIAATGPENRAEDRFIIEINLGEDAKLTIDKKIGVIANDVVDDVIDVAPIAMITANKREEGGGGEPI